MKKETRIYKCIECGHQLKTKESFYKSPCPRCNGKMLLYLVEIRGLAYNRFSRPKLDEKSEN